MMKKTSTVIWHIVLAHCVYAIDRLTKHVAIHMDGPIESPIPCLSWSYVKNRGISWGMLYSHDTVSFVLTTIIICAVIVALVLHTYKQFQSGYSILGEVLVLSGAISNLVDRVCYAGVIDFIAISYHDYCFPVFNIADIAIVTGVGIMLIKLWRQNA
jgi:signal peptidase II